MIMSDSLKVITKRTAECSSSEISDFLALIISGGEVTSYGLQNRILQAYYLSFMYDGKILIGGSALKNPNIAYRIHIAELSQTTLEIKQFPYELGWIFISEVARGFGYSYQLTKSVMEYAEGFGVFATTRTDNLPMQRTLIKLGFISDGVAYKSQHGEYFLQLFIRSSAHTKK